MAQALQPAPLQPPPANPFPITAEVWKTWLYLAYQTIGQGGQGTFPKLQVATATFSGDNAAQALLTVDKGLYVNYSSTINNIIYGFACNVTRAAGSQFTVGAQINTWGGNGVTGELFGVVSQVVGYPGSNAPIVANESAACPLNSTTQLSKWGYNAVFKDRADNATASYAGLGSNQYNYFAQAFVIASQPRSSDGELCGWNVGINFLDQSLDQETVPAWSSSVTYSPGQSVSNAGVVWAAIQASLNQAPGAASLYWVQRTVGTTTNKAIGIDFSTLSITAMGRMASAIRFRATEFLHWEETGQVGTNFDAITSIHRICDNGGTLRLGVNVSTGTPYLTSSKVALGGGAAATLGTVGGSGPTTAAQDGWRLIKDTLGVSYWVPCWI